VLTLPAVPFVVAVETVPAYLGSHLSFGVISLLVMVPVLLGNPNLGWPRRLMAHPFVLWLGALSYGIYLWHVTIAYDLGIGGGEGGFWVVLVTTYALTIPLAAATYYVVERQAYKLVKRPLLRRRRSTERGARGP
jgi:peptidoglycan/LPS O-acetylase OafA/YrhL